MSRSMVTINGLPPIGPVGLAGVARMKVMYKLVILVMVFGLNSCGSGSDKQGSNDTVRPVKTLTLSPADTTVTRSFPGRVEASKRAELAFQIGGLLVELPVTEGQRISKGDLIARIREDEFRARLTSLEGQLDQARAVLVALQSGERPEERLRRESAVRAADARLANARTEYNRFARLIERNAVSRAQYERAEADLKVAEEEYRAAQQMLEKGSAAREEDIAAQEAAVRALEGRVDEVRIQLEDCTLIAPFDGVVAEVFVQANQRVQGGQPIIRYQNVEEIDIAVDVPEAIMTTVLRSPSIVSKYATFTGAPGRQFAVRVREMSKFADPVTQTFTVRFSMPTPGDISILPGMSASVTVSRKIPSVAMQVPLVAVVSRPDGESIVWLVSADGTVKARPVILGQVYGSRVAINGGLEIGDTIAIAGTAFLHEEMRVRDLGDALGGRY